MTDYLTLDMVKPDCKTKLSLEEKQKFEDCLTNYINSTSDELTVLDGIYVIDNFISIDECNHLINNIDNSPYLSFWRNCSNINEITRAKQFRNVDTLECHSLIIAENIWNRLKNYNNILSNITINDNDDRDRDITGTWISDSINPDLLFAKYGSEGFFSPHTDGNVIHSFNLRSFYSIIIFLDEDLYGGSTKFYSLDSIKQLKLLNLDDIDRWTCEQSYKIAEIKPKKGRLLMFDQRFAHEGTPPSIVKHIIRTDVMFKRSQSICDSPEDILAYELFKEAEVIAESGDIDKSIALFKKAFKLSPQMASLLGY